MDKRRKAGKREPRGSLSVSKEFYDRLESAAAARGVPLSAIVEITIARAIGMPLDQLPPAIHRWVDRVLARTAE